MSEVECSNEHRTVKTVNSCCRAAGWLVKGLSEIIVNNLDNMWVTLCNLDIEA